MFRLVVLMYSTKLSQLGSLDRYDFESKDSLSPVSFLERESPIDSTFNSKNGQKSSNEKVERYL